MGFKKTKEKNSATCSRQTPAAFSYCSYWKSEKQWKTQLKNPPNRVSIRGTSSKDQVDRLPGTLAVLFMWQRGFLISFVVLIKLPTLNQVEKNWNGLGEWELDWGLFPAHLPFFIIVTLWSYFQTLSWCNWSWFVQLYDDASLIF